MPCYLQSATAGVVSPREGRVRAVCTDMKVLTDWPCAIDGCESCQAGNRAALNSYVDVPQASLSRAGLSAACMCAFRWGVYGLTMCLAFILGMRRREDA